MYSAGAARIGFWGPMTNQTRRDEFLAALGRLGASAGNGKLRETLQRDEVTYGAVVGALVADGAVTPGRGHGGSVSLGGTGEVGAEEATPGAAPAKRRQTNGNGKGGDLGIRGRTLQGGR